MSVLWGSKAPTKGARADHLKRTQDLLHRSGYQGPTRQVSTRKQVTTRGSKASTDPPLKNGSPPSSGVPRPPPRAHAPKKQEGLKTFSNGAWGLSSGGSSDGGPVAQAPPPSSSGDPLPPQDLRVPRPNKMHVSTSLCKEGSPQVSARKQVPTRPPRQSNPGSDKSSNHLIEGSTHTHKTFLAKFTGLQYRTTEFYYHVPNITCTNTPRRRSTTALEAGVKTAVHAKIHSPGGARRNE